MPATGKEAGNAAPPAVVAAASPNKLKAWLPMGVAVLAMPVLAFATTNWLLLPKLRQDLGLTTPAKATEAHGEAKAEKGGGESAGHGGAAAAKGPHETVPMNKLVVNVSGTMGSRFLMAGLNLVSSSPDFKAKVESHDAQLRDTACAILSTKTLADLEKPGARNVL